MIEICRVCLSEPGWLGLPHLVQFQIHQLSWKFYNFIKCFQSLFSNSPHISLEFVVTSFYLFNVSYLSFLGYFGQLVNLMLFWRPNFLFDHFYILFFHWFLSVQLLFLDDSCFGVEIVPVFLGLRGSSLGYLFENVVFSSLTTLYRSIEMETSWSWI